MDLTFDLHEFGGKMCQWHVGMDAVYAVGSFAISGKVHPSRETIEKARDILSRDQERNQYGDEDSQEELAFLVACLDEILNLLPTS